MKIYIILTYTGTILAKLVKLYTRKEYSHVSISLDAELKQMYSFGRLTAYNPFKAGFVHEYIDKGTFKRFKNTKARIIELDIEEEQYYKMKNIINQMEYNKSIYKFNIIGLFAVALHLKIRKEKSFYCAEFVKYLIEESGVNIKLPELIKPENFGEIYLGREIYNGFLKEYKVKKTIDNIMYNIV